MKDNEKLKKTIQEIKLGIEEQNLERLYDGIDSLNEDVLSKEILLCAIKSKNIDIIDAVIEKTYKKVIDKDVIKNAIATEDKDIVRAVADSIYNQDVFLENRYIIQNAVLEEVDIRNLVSQLLSLSENDSCDCEMQEVLLETYLDVVKKHYKKGSLTSNFNMAVFTESIKNSIVCIAQPDLIEIDSLKTKDQFLLLPVYSIGHAFSAYVKKIDDDKYSMTFINLGVGTGEKAKGMKFFEEYTFNKKHAQAVLELFSLSVRKSFKEKTHDTEFTYHTIKYLSNEKHLLRVISAEQKVGNCFIKNLEKGIKFALATELTKAYNPKFDSKSLRKSQNKKINSKDIKLKFLYPFMEEQKIIKDYRTKQLKGEVMESLKKRFPKFENTIKNEWEKYQNNKQKSRKTRLNRSMSI